ncbi:MAG: marine proteobacterial sortase target protein [Pseudomonadota bacterium]
MKTLPAQNFTRNGPPGISEEKKPSRLSDDRFWCFGFVVSLVLILLSGAASANGLSNVKGGQLFFKTQGRLIDIPTLQSHVGLDITGTIARGTLTQVFQNTTNEWQEAIYAFPLIDDAAVDGMTIRIGEREIQGVVQEKLQAKKTYTKAKSQGKAAGLVEQSRPNLFTTSVANVPPQEFVEVEIRYQQTVSFDNGTFGLRFPMTLTPRYMPLQANLDPSAPAFESADTWSNDLVAISPPMMSDEVPRLNLIEIEVNLDAGLSLSQISSTNHAIVTNDTGRGYSVRLQDTLVPMDRDFELSWTPHLGVSPEATMFLEEVNGQHYAMFNVYPPDVSQQKSGLPRELILVVDSSGSMGGVSIVQAKAALMMALDKLKPGDYFNVIDFDSDARRLFDRALPVSQQSLDQAKDFVSRLSADGGTEMHRALALALADQPDSGLLRQVIFVTDGSVGNEDALFQYIQSQLGDTRLFTVGIGSAPNTYFMRSAARFGRGSYTYISSQDQVIEKMTVLFDKLESPALTDLAVQFSSFNAEVWPKRIPDLYQGEPLVFAAKIDSPLDKASISGFINQVPWKRQVHSGVPRLQSGIAKLWARNKIAALLDQKILGTDLEEIKKKVVPIALEHSLVTPYTSLVAVDKTPINPNPDQQQSHKVPNHLPAGTQFPATATNWQLKLLFGFILSLWSLAILNMRRIRRPV